MFKTPRSCPPAYTLDQLVEWAYNNGFKQLYDTWVRSGMTKDTRPSCDRHDDELPYTFDNLQLVTWKENCDKGYARKIAGTGVYARLLRPVVKYTLDGEFIEVYVSISEAARQNGVSDSNIHNACSGVYSTSGGYTWQFL